MTDRPTGQPRPALSLSDDAMERRRRTWEQARMPSVQDKAAFDRWLHPQIGDLVYEPSGKGGRGYHDFGVLLAVRDEPLPIEEGEWDNEVVYERVLYIQYGPEPEDVCRWTNAEVHAVIEGRVEPSDGSTGVDHA